MTKRKYKKRAFYIEVHRAWRAGDLEGYNQWWYVAG